MTAEELVATLRAKGVELVLAGDRLRFRPGEVVTAVEREALRRLKAEVLALLISPGLSESNPCRTAPGDPAAGFSAASLADFARHGQIVIIQSRTLAATVYLCPDLEAVTHLVEAGISRARCYLPGELANLAGLFRLEPPQRAAVLQTLDALRETFGEVDVVSVTPRPTEQLPLEAQEVGR